MKPHPHTLRLLLAALPLALSLCSCRQMTQVYDLRCEGLVEPLGIDSAQPHFSWKIKSGVPLAQSAYQIQVEPSGLWDSGFVESPDQVMVPYGGRQLSSRQQCRWRVRIRDGEGRLSRWSGWQRFGVGIIAPDSLRGDFIGAAPGEGRACALRKVFDVDKAGVGLLYLTSLGYHEVFLNGEKIGRAVLSPAVSQLDRRSLILVYELPLRRGGNELCVEAGSGWYKSTTFGAAYEGPLVKAQLDLDGETVLCTDASWEGAWNGYRDLGRWRPHQFGGEYIDASHVREWGPVDVVGVEGIEASMQMCGPCLVQEILTPVSVQERPDGSYMVDFGRIVNAMVDFTLPGMDAGTKVTATFSDYVREDGTLEEATRGEDVYVACGQGETERFRNRFNHHLMRYVLLEGLPCAPDPSALKALRIGDDLRWRGSFESSDKELDAIYDLVRTTMCNLTFGGYMVDCASIERLGYGGDGNASALSLQMSADAGPLYLNWLQAWADAQREDGGLPHTAPNPYTAGGGPYWCSFPVQASWLTFLSYGDSRPLRRMYPTMKRWLAYVDKYSVDGLLKRWPDEPYRGWYLGDWAAPKGIDVQDPSSVDLVNNCALCRCYLDLEQIARTLGLEDDALQYRQRYEALSKRVHETFFHDGIYATGSQVDMAYPLLVGVTPSDLRGEVAARLKERTETLYGGHLSTGLVGVPVVTRWATLGGEVQWFYSLLKEHGYPGYLYMLDNGATGVWEEWDGGRSHLHNCYNGVLSWFYEALGGIVPLEPGYRKVRISPQVPEGLERVRVCVETPYGPLEVERVGTSVHVDAPCGVEVVR